MRTSKPFSTISYNTSEFLKVKLDELIRRGVMDFWAFVLHHPEDDETKTHTHVYLVPSRLMDASTMIDYLEEFDASEPLAKPLTCIIPQSSKFADWYQYACHDAAYLATKGQARRYHYGLEDFVASSPEYFSELRHQIDYSKNKVLQRVMDAVEDGRPLYEMVQAGLVPLNLIPQVRIVHEILLQGRTNRNGRSGHEVDPDTGEVLDEADS